jgi:type IV secretion system protein VirB4
MDFEGMDIDSTPNEVLNQARQQVAYALEQLQELGCVVTWHVRRRITTKYPSAQFPDPVSQRMDELQHDLFIADEQYVNRHSLTLAMYPQGASARLLGALERSQQRGEGWLDTLKALGAGLWSGIKGEDEFPYKSIDEVQAALEQFDRALDMFLAATSNLNTKVLRGEQLGGFLRLCSTPTDEIDQLSYLPNQDVYMDTAMPAGQINNEFRDVLEFEHNGRTAWASAYSLSLEKRESVDMAMLDKLMAAPFEFSLTHVFKMLPRGRAQRVVGEVEAYHANRRYPLKSILAAAMAKGDLSGVPVNESRAQAADEARSAKDRISSGNMGLGMYYGTVIVQAQNIEKLMEARKACEGILQSARFEPRLEGLHKLSSWCATIPGSHAEVSRWYKIDRENFVDMCPVRTVDTGAFLNEFLSDQLGQPCTALVALPTKHRTPYYYTGYVGDLGHELIIGPSGTGKTAFATLIWTAFRKYPDSRVVVFDKNYSCRPAIYLQGGSYIDLNPDHQASEQRHKMSPIAALMRDGRTDHIPFLAKWIEMLASMRGYNVTADNRRALEQALRATAELGVNHPEQLRLGTVVVKLSLADDFGKALMMWVGDTAYGGYFDNDSDDFNLDTLVGIEMGTILSDEELAAPFMAYAFYRLASQLREMGAHEKRPIPTLIYIPETWYFLRQKVFQAELEEWLVTLRKLGARITFDTQNPDKLVQSPIFPAFRDNVPNMIFTPNTKAKTSSLMKMYTEELAMTEEEIQFIVNGQPKRDYYMKQGELSRRISLAMPRELIALVRSDVKAQKALEQHISKGLPIGWQQVYLKELMHE